MNTTNERPTPETDALQAQEWKPNWAAHARRLERERDEAREDAQAQARLLGMSSEREAKLLAQLAVERALADRLAGILDLYYADDDIVHYAGIADALEAWKEARND